MAGLHTQSPAFAHMPAELAVALVGFLAQLAQLFGIVEDVGEALPFPFVRLPGWISRLAVIGPACARSPAVAWIPARA